MSADLGPGAVSENRKLGPVLATALVAGNMIGSGVYLLPVTLASVGSASVLGWVICTVGALLLAAVFSALAIVRPLANGLVAYAEEALGPYVGFQAGFIYWLSIWTGVIAIAVAFTAYLSFFLPVLKQPLWGLASTIGVVLLFTAINVVGPRFMGKVGALTLVVGLAPVLAVATLGWSYFDPEVFRASWNVTDKPALQALQVLLVPIFWAFTGVESATVFASVVRNPSRNIPIASIGGTLIAAAVYIAATAAISGLMPATELAKSTAPFSETAVKFLGAAAAALITVCALFKTAGTVGGWVLVTAETTRASADVGHFPRWMARVAGNGAPVRALLAMAVLMAITAVVTATGTLARQFEVLVNVSVVLSLVVYGYACIALVRIAGRQAAGRSAAAMRAVAVLALAFCVWIILVSEPEQLIVSVAVIAATAPLWLGLRQVTAARRRKAVSS